MKKDAFVETVVTGTAWTGGGVASIDTALRELVAGTIRELHVVTYSISDGADLFLDALERLLSNGARITFIAEQIANQHGRTPSRLKDFASRYGSHFSLFDFEADHGALHAKCIISDRRKALVGSANLSFNGLVRNHELAVLIEGRAVEDLTRAVERLPNSPDVRQILPQSR